MHCYNGTQAQMHQFYFWHLHIFFYFLHIWRNEKKKSKRSNLKMLFYLSVGLDHKNRFEGFYLVHTQIFNLLQTWYHYHSIEYVSQQRKKGLKAYTLQIEPFYLHHFLIHHYVTCFFASMQLGYLLNLEPYVVFFSIFSVMYFRVSFSFNF